MDSLHLQALQDLAAARHGVFSTTAAERIGIDRRTLDHLEHRGWLRRVRRGVYALGGAPGSRWEAAVAAAVALGPDGVLSHSTAAAIHGFDGFLPGLPELTVHALSRRRLEGTLLHRTGPIPARQIVERRGVPVASPVRTLVDVAGSMSAERLGNVLDDGVVQRTWTLADVAACLDDQPRRRRGVATLRQLLELRCDEAVGDSQLEQRVFRFLEPLRPFAVHHQVIVAGRVYVLDVAWPGWRIAAEIDGRTYRTASRSAFERETLKLNDLTSADWLVAHLSAGMDAARCCRAVTNLMAMRGLRAPG